MEAIMSEATLHLHEEILLLALDDDKGTVHFGVSWQMAAGAAMVAELMFEGRVRLTDEKKPKLEVVDATPLGDPLLDEALAEMDTSKKLRRGAEWVQKLAGQGKLKQRIAGELVRKRVLREEEGKVLWVFGTTHYPERDGRHEREVIARLKRAIFSSTRDVTPRTVVLVALADTAGLLKKIFDKQRLKDRKRRIKDLTEGQVTSAMAKEAMEAMQAAVAVCCIMPAIIVTTTT
jgi:hypothetical protein